MNITDPKQLNEHYNELFRNGDLEGLIDLCEANAVLRPAPGVQLNGHRQIREQMAALLTLRGELAATQVSCVQQDDLTLLHAKWSFKGTRTLGHGAHTLGRTINRIGRRYLDRILDGARTPRPRRTGGLPVT